MVLRSNFIFPGDATSKPQGSRNLPSKSPQRNISKGPVRGKHRAIASLAATLPKKALKQSLGRTLNLEEKQGGKSLSASKNLTPKSSDQRGLKSSKHKRIASLAERPLSHNILRNPEPENTNKRKFSLESKTENPRIIKYAHYTQTGYIPGNTAKVNQDSFFEHINFANYPDLYLFGVCDGHGFYGGEVSGFVKQRLPILLSQDPEIYTNPKKALTVNILKCNSELSQASFDVNFSGSTLVLVLIKGNILYCANVGDSRALVARQVNDGSNNMPTGRHWMSIALSRDHKPDDKNESLRIIQCNGRVESYQDENGNPVGPSRV